MTAVADTVRLSEDRPSQRILAKYLARIDPQGAANSKWRKANTVLDPMLFALIYLPHHLKNDAGKITISEVHEDWCSQAKRWIATSAAVNTPSEIEIDPVYDKRHAFIAPRDMGKSTWWFLILPLWAAAHGHKKFAAAFADAGQQSEIHLTTFKNELDKNKLIRQDFPDLCAPQKRENSGQSVSDSRTLIVQRNGFSFAARGIDAANLGLKIDENRPDLIIFDDIEPHESNYTPYQADKRLATVIEAVLPMNLVAHVIFVGTVTMSGSIIHQLVESVETNKEPAEWIDEQSINVHYYPPIIIHDDGSESSIWPERWSLRYLKSIQHTRSYAKNFRNKPLAHSGDYWQDDDIVVVEDSDGVTWAIISIDPAVTKKKTSDFSGIANLALRPGFRPAKGSKARPRLPKVLVMDVAQVKLTGERLRKKVMSMIVSSPVPIRMIYIEVNQGGDTWYSVFHDMPVPVRVVTNSIPKEIRAANLLGHYQRGHVEHIKDFPDLVDQMLNYPDVLHDDLIDAVGNGVTWFAKRRRRRTKPQAKNVAYV